MLEERGGGGGSGGGVAGDVQGMKVKMEPLLERKEMEWGPVGQAAVICGVFWGKARCLAGEE